VTDIRDAVEEGCVGALSRGACEDCMFERFWFQATAGGGGIGLGHPPGGVCRLVALPSSHLMYPSCYELAQAYKGARAQGWGVAVVGGGGNSRDQSSMSASLTLFFRAEYVLSIRNCGGRLGKTSGTRCALIIRTLERPPVKAIVLWATASIGRWFRRGGEGRAVFPLRGR